MKREGQLITGPPPKYFKGKYMIQNFIIGFQHGFSLEGLGFIFGSFLFGLLIQILYALLLIKRGKRNV